MEEIKKKLKARVGHLKDEGALNHARELTALLEYVEDLENKVDSYVQADHDRGLD
tara:strand:- start:12248 stop:12412 length:165 start_codon:yes stop_codon:yes gene_type:complete